MSDEPRILEVCNRCGGTGWEPVPDVALAVRTCWTCGGSGQPRRNRVPARYACRGALRLPRLPGRRKPVLGVRARRGGHRASGTTRRTYAMSSIEQRPAQHFRTSGLGARKE